MENISEFLDVLIETQTDSPGRNAKCGLRLSGRLSQEFFARIRKNAIKET